MLAAVISESGPRTVAEDFESYLGKFKAGDVVLDVRKLEPVSLGSSHYIYTDKTFPIFVEDIRKRKMQDYLQEVDHSRRSSRLAQNSGAHSGEQRQQQWYVLSAAGKLDVLKLISAEEMVGDRRELSSSAALHRTRQHGSARSQQASFGRRGASNTCDGPHGDGCSYSAAGRAQEV